MLCSKLIGSLVIHVVVPWDLFHLSFMFENTFLNIHVQTVHVHFSGGRRLFMPF